MNHGKYGVSRRTVTSLLGGLTLFPPTRLASQSINSPNIPSGTFEATIKSIFEEHYQEQAFASATFSPSLLTHSSLQELKEIFDLARSSGMQLFHTKILLESVIQRFIHEDFCNDAVSFVDGWILSLTEASIFAFARKHFKSSPLEASY